MASPITNVSPYPIAADRVFPLPEASMITGLSVDTLKRCGARKELRILKLSPRRIGIRLSDLQIFVDGRITDAGWGRLSERDGRGMLSVDDSSSNEGRGKLRAGPAQRLAHASNKKIATLAKEREEQISAYVAKQNRKARRKNAAPEISPTRERLAKGDLAQVPIYAPNGFVEGHRYEGEPPPGPIDRYKPHLPERVQDALAFFAHGELLRETAPFRNLTSKVDREIFPSQPGRKLGGMARVDKDERREYERHEFGLRQLRALDDAEDRASVEDTLRAVVGYARDGLMGKPVKIADIGRKLWNFDGEEAAKGVAIGAILVAGKFLAHCYEWFDAHYQPGLPSQMRQLGPPIKR